MREADVMGTDAWIERRSRTRDQMMHAARSGCGAFAERLYRVGAGRRKDR
jgi:hypothetical protein